MEFKDYANGLLPYISYGKTDADFFVAIIGNFIEDAAMDSCKLLQYKPDTQYRYMTGKPIQKKDAQYVYKHRDSNKYVQWIYDCIDDSDSHEQVNNWLRKNKMPGEYAENECQELLESIILSICDNSKTQKKPPSPFEESLDLIKEINSKIKNLTRPIQIPVPINISAEEDTYINELFSAYGDAESIDGFCEINFTNYPDYREDLNDRRVDYYAAISIERGVMELDAENISNQFYILKDEMLDNVKDTSKKRYLNGYEKMLSVMEQASIATLNNYLLSNSPFWINGKIKKGVCHHLVNDGKLKWVKKK